MGGGKKGDERWEGEGEVKEGRERGMGKRRGRMGVKEGGEEEVRDGREGKWTKIGDMHFSQYITNSDLLS